jgi:SNF family Na+-dependent transporter
LKWRCCCINILGTIGVTQEILISKSCGYKVDYILVILEETKQWISNLIYRLGVLVLSSMKCWRFSRWKLIEEAWEGFEEICESTWCVSYVCCLGVWDLQLKRFLSMRKRMKSLMWWKHIFLCSKEGHRE